MPGYGSISEKKNQRLDMGLELVEQQVSMEDSEQKDLDAAAFAPPVSEDEITGQSKKHKQLSAQDIAYDAIEFFDRETEQEAEKNGQKKSIETSSLREILQMMEEDSESKSTQMMSMQMTLKMLLEMKELNEEAEKKGRVSIDYRDALYFVENAAHFYASTHTKGIFLSKSGKNRYRMSCRIATLIAPLRMKIDQLVKAQTTATEQEEARTGEQTEEDVAHIIDSGNFTSEEAGKELKDWQVNGKKYRETLMRLIKGDKQVKGDRETLLKFLADKNRLLIANKTAMSMVCDEHMELTYGLSGLKKLLSEYMEKKLNESPETQEKIYTEVKEFRSFINGCIRDFSSENSSLLKKVGKRWESMLAGLSADAGDRSLWGREEVNYLMLEAEDAEFANRLNEYAIQKEENEKLIEQIVRDAGYSSMTNKAIVKKIREKLASVVIFGAETEIAEQTEKYLEVAHIFCADEVGAERRVSMIMMTYQIPEEYRDALILKLSRGAKGDNMVKTIAQGDVMLQNEAAQGFAENLQFGIKTLEKTGIYRRALSRKQWKEIDKLRRYAGVFERESFSRELKKILADKTGEKITREEYKKGLAASGRRGIGFSARILGDQFLSHKDMQGILKEDEVEWFRENLIRALAPDEETFAALEHAQTIDIMKIAGTMRKVFRELKDRIAAMHADDKLDKSVCRQVLLRIASENIGEGDFERILEEEKKAFTDREALAQEMKAVKAVAKGDVSGGFDCERKYETYKKRRKLLADYEQGRFAVLSDYLMNDPEFYREMMNCTDEEAVSFLKETEEKYGALADALRTADVSPVVKQMYLDKKFDDIKSGVLKGEVIFWKREIRLEDKLIHEEKQQDGSTINENVKNATKEVIKEILREEKSDLSKKDRASAIDGFIQYRLRKLYQDKDGFDKLQSKSELKEDLYLAYKAMEENRRAAFQAFGKRLKDKNSPFFNETDQKKKKLIGRFAVYIGEAAADEADTEAFKKKLSDSIKVFEEKAMEEGKRILKKAAPPENETIRKETEERLNTEKAALSKAGYLLMEDEETKAILKDIREKKALVTFGSEKNTALSHGNWEMARERVRELLAPYLGNNLSPLIVNCLIEKNTITLSDRLIGAGINVTADKALFGGEQVKKKWTRILASQTFDEHAKWLARVHDILSRPDKGEDPLSEDEKNLMIVHIYRNEESFFSSETKEHTDDRRVIKGQWYKDFRRKYKSLKKMEKMEIADPLLEQERINISRDLRGLLVTAGMKSGEEQSPGEDRSFETRCKRAFTYLDQTNKLCTLIAERLEANEKYRGLAPSDQASFVLGLRSYYHGELMEQLTAQADREAAFDKEKWAGKLDEVIGDATRMHYITGAKLSVGSESYHKRNTNFAETVGMEAIDETISKYGWRSQRKKYESLTPQQKELFALGLMLLDKGALGADGGSNEVLSNPELRKKETSVRLIELSKCMQGASYDFRIDYVQAAAKLTNFGATMFSSGTTALSDTAFDKAFAFAEGIWLKMNSATKEDIERASDAESVIGEAALLGKTQQAKELEKLKRHVFDTEMFKTQLLSYAEEDAGKLNKSIGNASIVPFARNSMKKEKAHIERVLKRIAGMDELEIRRLIAVLQNRTVLDQSLVDKSNVMDADKREELALMFSEENEAAALRQFTTNSMCFNALSSILGFKLRDDKKIGDDTLRQEHFDNVSFHRTANVDWELVERAFQFLDEQKHARLARYAMRNSKDFIESSGNTKAIREYRSIKSKTTINEKDTIEFLKKQAKMDAESGDNEDAILAVGGFMKLDEAEKRLFFKVLGSRDLLDMSKKNLYRNIYNAGAERSYANETGRFRLIDEYIEKTRSGNTGIPLDKTAHYEALRSLLSTQVDDTADFKSAEHVRDLLATERNLFMQRKTAVDWKLFNRALQFVNRARYERKIREGNAELYRSSGELSKYGRLSMDYSILRKNIHNTGNQFLRFGVQRAKKAGFEIMDAVLEFQIGPVTVDLESLSKMFELAGKLMPEGKLKAVITEFNEEVMRGGKDTLGGIKTKTRYFNPAKTIKKTENMRKSKEKEATGQFQYIKNTIDNIMADEAVFEKGIESVGALIGDAVGVSKVRKKENGKKKEKEDILEKQVGKFKVQKRYGDIRDGIMKVVHLGKKAKGIYDKAKESIPGFQVEMDDGTTKVLLDAVTKTVVDRFTKAFAGEEKGPIADTLKVSLEKAKKAKLDALKESRLKELIANKKVPENYQFSDKDIKSHKFWKAEEEELTNAEKRTVVEKSGKDFISGILDGIFGKGAADGILEVAQTIQEFTTKIQKAMTWVSEITGAVRFYAESITDIVKRSQNKNELKDAKQRSQEEDVKKKDEETLKKGSEFQTEEQEELTAETVKHHLDMQKMANDISNNIQNLYIGKDVMDMVMETGIIVATSLGAAGPAVKAVAAAVKAGVDMILYCIRVVKDRAMLKDYYTTTQQGQRHLFNIVNGVDEAFGRELGEKNSALAKEDFLQIICKGEGYDKVEELVTDTGMRMATSIAFCASKYNPVLETRIQATTAMAVLGMKDQIGKTDAQTIKGIFDAMKAA